jgi:hypothetical protein
MVFSDEVDSDEQTAEGGLRLDDSTLSQFGEFVKALGAAASFGRRFARSSGEEALLFEPVEGSVEGAGRRLPTRTRLNLGSDTNPVRGVLQAKNGKEHNLFEFTER